MPSWTVAAAFLCLVLGVLGGWLGVLGGTRRLRMTLDEAFEELAALSARLAKREGRELASRRAPRAAENAAPDDERAERLAARLTAVRAAPPALDSEAALDAAARNAFGAERKGAG